MQLETIHFKILSAATLLRKVKDIMYTHLHVDQIS